MPESLKKFETHQKNYIKTHPKGIDGSKEKIVIEFLEQLIKENNLAICVPFDCFNDIKKQQSKKSTRTRSRFFTKFWWKKTSYTWTIWIVLMP